jgi:predicted GNAT family N-acyltransferase
MTETRTHEGASLMLSRPKIDGLPADANLVEITRVYTKPERRKQGDARWLLCEVCVQADETQTFLMLSPKPFDDEPMDADALEGFYRRFGFKVMQREADDGTPHVIMVRKPK